ncbi:MAG: hypothetical protein JXR58_06855 [Bacteroidales bacterium]|nr:hypothetical protein [Bacteroidales bacterium]
MKHLILTLAFFFLFFQGSLGQNLIGKSVDLIKKYMTAKYPKYYCDDTSLKGVHSSIKFIDEDEMRTLMFFFDENNKCKYSKFIIDNTLIKVSLDSLNRKYEYKGNLVWIEQQKTKKFAIAMQKNEWFFTIIIQPKEN